MMDSTAVRAAVTHMLCCSCAMYVLFRGAFLGKIPRQHELGLEHGPGLPNPAIQSGGHPFANRMSELSLHVIDRIAGIAFVPGPVQLLCDAAELDNEVLAQVFWLGLAPLFSP